MFIMSTLHSTSIFLPKNVSVKQHERSLNGRVKDVVIDLWRSPDPPPGQGRARQSRLLSTLSRQAESMSMDRDHTASFWAPAAACRDTVEPSLVCTWGLDRRTES